MRPTRFLKLNSLLFLTAGLLCGGGLPDSCADEQPQTQPLSFESFIELATANDTQFERILIDELSLKYQKRIELPAGDLVFSVKQQHEFYFSQDRDSPDTAVSLSKLFPFSGTEIGAAYEVGASAASAKKSSQLSFTLAQPIAENAFGRNTRLLDKITGLEIDVARHQITEAYEDYLASVMSAYYTWEEDYQNLSISRSSYRENSKLLKNMRRRQEQKIALPIDVNKVELQVLSKKERLIELEEKYKASTKTIETIIRSRGETGYSPQDSSPPGHLEGGFKRLFRQFTQTSRTFAILRKLEQKSSLQVARDADDLLPSINITAEYGISGERYRLDDDNNFFYAGVSMEWPFPDAVKRGEYAVSKILTDKQRLSTENAYYRLTNELFQLYLLIEREQQLMEIADTRIRLAASILEDETENYSFGKITLNDYIQAFNALDENRFNKIAHESQYKKSLLEWLRLSDQLVKSPPQMPRMPSADNSQ